MKLRKILCLTIAVIMSFGLITGCISDEPESPNPVQTSGNEPASTAGAGEGLPTTPDAPETVSGDEIQALMELEGLELVNGHYRFKQTKKITVELFDRALEDGRTEPLESYWTKWVQHKVLEDHNIEVTYRTVPRWTEEIEISNILASGDAPDIMYTYNYPAIQTYADMNGILDMSKYVDDYKFLAENLWDLLGSPLIYFNRDPISGHIWAIEGIKNVNTRINTFVREDWLAKLGFEEPTTLEEFEFMLYAFKNNAELLLGAEADKIIPLTIGEDVGWRAEHLLHSFVPNAITDKEIYVLGFDDRRFTYPGIKEGVRVLNKWYNDGLIWTDFAMHKVGDSTEDNLMKSGVVGAMIHNWNYPFREYENGIETMLKQTVGSEAGFIPVASFKDDANTYRKFMPVNNDRKICFPATNKEPVASLIYLDFVSRIDVRGYIGSGEEGINYKITDGIAYVLDPTSPDLRDGKFTASFATESGKTEWTYAELIMNSPQNIDYLLTFNSDSNIFFEDGELTRKSESTSYPAVSPEIVEKALYMTQLDHRTEMNINVGKIEAEVGMSRSLPSKRNEAFARAIVAAPDKFDDVWDNGMQDYLNSGGQAIIDERTAKWEQFNGDKLNLD